MVISAGNECHDLSSNPGQGSLHFTANNDPTILLPAMSE